MLTHRDIHREIEQLTVLSDLVKAYGEISAARMRRARDSVLYSRKFLAAINEIFGEVRASYLSEVRRLTSATRFKRGKGVTFLAHNGKTVSVLLSANTRLYGDLLYKTFTMFLTDLRASNSEATIIGKVGLSLFLEAEPHRPYTYFDFPDKDVDQSALVEIVRHLVQYETIRLYFGRYVSLLSQQPAEFTLTAQITPNASDEVRTRVHYIFEPGLEEILQFFERQIFDSLFSQTIRESQLSKFAARLLAMDQAEQNISRRLEAVSFEKLRVTHEERNARQLTRLTTLKALWQ